MAGRSRGEVPMATCPRRRPSEPQGNPQDLAPLGAESVALLLVRGNTVHMSQFVGALFAVGRGARSAGDAAGHSEGVTA